MNDTERFQQVAELFEAARSRHGDDRDTFLRDVCTDDPDLLDEVCRLLTHHDAEDAPLDKPVVPDQAMLDLFPSIASPPVPERIGRYTIKSQLGIGGMGVVYLAEQDHPQRRVAIKVLRPGLVNPGLLRRFELEAAALGRLQHPGIAQIYEAGTFNDGAGPRPYFAMELVDGKPLTDYADAHGLGTRDRLVLFARVCAAVHHAHQRGIIHRDIKPGNVLVDATGQPRVLDFGIARATDSDLQVTTIQTDASQLLGTLPYMSPEQVAGRSSAVDTRADVYALGVVLFELLTGRLPYHAEHQSFVTLARVIVEEDPISPASIDSALRGDLSTIILHAIEKDPDRRYQSASELADDVHRFLGHEPIAARPATAAYHLARFARRHVVVVAASAAVCLAVFIGGLVIVWQSSRVRAEADTRRQVAGFLREMLTSIDPGKTAGGPLSVREMLDDASARLNGSFADAPLVGADLHETIGTTYRNLGAFEKSEAHLRRTLDAYREAFGRDDDRTLGAVASLGLTLRELDNLEEADILLAGHADAASRGDGPGALSLLTTRAIVLDALGEDEPAETLYREVYARKTAALGEAAPSTLNARLNLGKHLMDRRAFADAAAHFEACRRGLRAAYGDDHPETIMATANLGAACGNLGRLDEGAALLAEAVERSVRVLGPVHLHTLRRRRNLVLLEWQHGDRARAQTRAGTLLTDCQSTLGRAHEETIRALELHTTLTALGGDMDGAERRALAWHDRLAADLGPDHRLVGRVAYLLVNLYESWDKPRQEARWRQRVEETRFAPSEGG
ncbi:MAG: protein kinase [Planctomycetota bacterium]|nr:protein kinase [Planctomycetota bacterium]